MSDKKVIKSYEKLLLENKAWATSKVQEDPEFFKRLSGLQTPEFLWIGSSDSRVPADRITGTQPGEIFVHRNIANMVVNTDVNLLAVLDFAVVHLKVKHVIVCGHYGCGGVLAALRDLRLGLIDNWLRHVQDVERDYEDELALIADPQARENRLCELNVAEQVRNIARTTIVQDAWRRGHDVQLHGWIYGLKDGIITDLGVSLRA